MIYFMRDTRSGSVKIGWSESPKRRQEELQQEARRPLQIIRLLDGPKWGERWLHYEFHQNRLTGEWFTNDPRMMVIELPLERPKFKSLVKRGAPKPPSGIIAVVLGIPTPIFAKFPAELARTIKADAARSGVSMREWLMQASIARLRGSEAEPAE